MKLTLTLIITTVLFVNNSDIPLGMTLVPTDDDNVIAWISRFY